MTDRPLLIDLFCGAGGAAMGYHRAGFDLLGVDINPQPRYPFDFIQGDVFEVWDDLPHGDAWGYHASPPCQRFSEATPMERRSLHPDMIAPTRELFADTDKPYVIENVSGARGELHAPIMLCGSMFGLSCFRHRFFEVSSLLILAPPCRHDFTPLLVTTAGSNSRRIGNFKSIDHAVDAYDIGWMIGRELAQAIPPAYTEWIGKQLLKAVPE